MTPLAQVFLALVCSIFVTTSEPADHGHYLIADKADMHRTNPRLHLYNNYRHKTSAMRQYDVKHRTKRDAEDERCEPFTFKPGKLKLYHPRIKGSDTYSNQTTCITTIEAPDQNHVIILTFVDVFEMEDRAPECEYDYLEIRDGKFGYALPVHKLCGKSFPNTITSAGPYLWLKFKSDDSIEYAGFTINIVFQPDSQSKKIPNSCYISIPEGGEIRYGEIDSESEEAKLCRSESHGAVDIQWKVETPPGTRIFLNFTDYKLVSPNECEVNLVQVFGSEPNFDHKLANYCGSMANQVTTKTAKEEMGPTNILYVRMYTTMIAKDSKFKAHFTAFRTLEGEDKCGAGEFDCADGTCIDDRLQCDSNANCRLKADEETELCDTETQSLVKEPHILVILVIFSLILSGMSFVFLFKCIRKLYQDHKYIKEHLAKSCEDRLDKLEETQLTLDPNLLARDTEPRASLERENHTNEMYKQQRNKRKSSSIDSDFLHDHTPLDLNDDWPESIPIPPEEVRIEYKGRQRRSDTNKREESLRRKDSKESERKENRDVSVGAPDTKESGCQTRESLFQVDPPPSSDGTNSGSGSRGFSTFGYSGATIVRPSSPAANTSEITIELLRQVTPQESTKSQKKFDRRPMSTETTRSAPDVIIVSKPIR